MVSAKDLIIKPISSQNANRIIKILHYSHKVVNNSQLHFGVFIGGKCGGALQFGPSLDKRKIMGLVENTKWNEFIELNRMALADWMPQNSGSRALSVCLRLIRKHYPHIKWVISFADGTQCGHGTQYQAVGFYLTGITISKNIASKGNFVIHKMTLESNPKSKRDELGGRSYYEITNGRYNFKRYVDYIGGVILPGYQFRYIYFLDGALKDKLTVPIIPYSKIDELGARMYRGKRVKESSEPSVNHTEKGGAAPTGTLQQAELING